MTALSRAWNVPIAVVSYVISGVGIGRLLAYLITGYFSDKLSRKFFVYLGMLCYFLFAVGIPFSKSIPLSYFFAILAGVANSALDAGTYTTFVEMAHGNGRYNVLIKAVASIGEFIIPLLVSLFAHLHAWYGWSFIVMALILVINAFLLLPLKFPKQGVAEAIETVDIKEKSKGIKIFTSILFALYGYLSMALMIWYTQWITLFGQNTVGFTNIQSHFLLSLYSIGSIVGVILLFILLGKNVSENAIMIAMNIIATASLLAIIVSKNIAFSEIASFMFGFSAASGVMQTGLTAFMRLYPARRGFVTGIFYFFGAMASFTVPIITGLLSKESIKLAFGADIVIGIVAVIVVTLIALLMRKTNKTAAN